MSELIALAFDDEFKAEEVLTTLAKLQKEYLVDLEDACVVVRKEDGKVKLKQAYNLVAAGAAGGSFWGLLLGILFLHPLVGVIVGAAAGALSGSATDYGIDDNFMKNLGKTMEPGTSAIFMLIRKSTPDKVIPELQKFHGKILRTSLSKENEEKLQKALDGEKVPEGEKVEL